MEIQITGRNDRNGNKLEVTPAIRQFIQEKFGKLTAHFKNITNIHVILNISQGFQHEAEAHVDLSKGNLVATATSKDMYESIDLLVHKIDRQIVKHKEELKDHKNKPHHNGLNANQPDALE